jgi:hypothetical protein
MMQKKLIVRRGTSSSIFFACRASGFASLYVSLTVKRAFWPPHVTKRDIMEAEELDDDRMHMIPEAKDI